jgi:anaerobic magnesium-protoporphyrin IX monomethyl ester cyclase
VKDSGIFLCVIPKHSLNVPPMSLGYLQAACRKYGIETSVRDFNWDLWNKTIHTDYWEIWKESDTTLFQGQGFKNFYHEIYREELDRWAQEIVDSPHLFVGISCFSHRSMPTFKLLAKRVRQLAPHKKIVVGGAPMNRYHQWILSSELADYVVISEGEEVLPKIVRGEISPGLVKPGQISNLDELAIPDYSGLDIDNYQANDPIGIGFRKDPERKRPRQVALMASRGCVRKCTFCDVEEYWPKYRWRTAENVFSEMKHLYEIHGVKDFYFFDSLVNGNGQEFERLMDLIIDAGSPFQDLRGLGIVRPQPERLYEKMKKANFNRMTIGVESFSPRVRRHMRKSFSDELLDNNLKLYGKYGIDVVLLMIVGYPSETEQDHLLGLKWMEDHRSMVNNPIKQIEIGCTMLIFPGAPVFKEKLFDYYVDSHGEWVTVIDGQPNTIEVRRRRRDEMMKKAFELGFGTQSVHGVGGQIIGDGEKRQVWQEEGTKPYLGYQPLNIELEAMKLENDEVRATLGWESDPARPLHVNWKG